MNFEFNKKKWFASAFYTSFTKTITLNFNIIVSCDKISDEDKMRLMTWQTEHEVIHAVIDKIEGYVACGKFDNMAWAINSKQEFLELVTLLKNIGYVYNGRCKYLDR